MCSMILSSSIRTGITEKSLTHILTHFSAHEVIGEL